MYLKLWLKTSFESALTVLFWLLYSVYSLSLQADFKYYDSDLGNKKALGRNSCHESFSWQ